MFDPTAAADELTQDFAKAITKRARQEQMEGQQQHKDAQPKKQGGTHFEKAPLIHPGRLIKKTPMEIFQDRDFCMQALKELKAATVKRRRSKKEKKREKRAWELRTNDGSNFFQPPTRHLTPEEEEALAYEMEMALQAQLEQQSKRSGYRPPAMSPEGLDEDSADDPLDEAEKMVRAISRSASKDSGDAPGTPSGTSKDGRSSAAGSPARTDSTMPMTPEK
jgi:hypothetical protein